ncbi:alpha-L-rhamnosidase [bacterium A37T11]|nr:alpha-L-rhamnosidase [bacterium A37T11]
MSRYLTGFLFLAVLLGAQTGRDGEDLSEQTFLHPPSVYGNGCFWWWLNGNVIKASITHDLEEMQKKGYAAAIIFDAGGADQGGNAAVPAGPLFGSPAWVALFKHACSEAARLGIELSLSIQSGWNLGGPNVTPQEAAKLLTWSETRISGGTKQATRLEVPPIRHNFYRDIAVLAIPVKGPVQAKPLSNLTIKGAFTEAAFSAGDMRYLLEEDQADTAGVQYASAKDVLDLSDRMKPDGTLNWQAPAGEWQVMRFGYTNNGAEVSTSSGNWKGLVVDYLSKAHFQRYWDRNVEPLLKSIGPLAGKTLRYLHTDSWELGGSNWTEDLRKEFSDRRKYDLLPYLPVIAGKVIGNRDLSNRFMADFRKTLGDCVADNHYATFAADAHTYGIGIHPESAGPHAGPIDGIKNYGRSDLVLSEFWSPSNHRPTPERRYFVKQASSAAHIYGKKLVGAEGFTTIGRHWNDVLWQHMKQSFDHEVCAGLNRLYIHTFTNSPKEMGMPGQEYFAGTHFNPNVTWWNESGAFLQYVRRVQYMLQEGRFVGDVLYYYGDQVPNIATLKAHDPAGALPYYDYDVVDDEKLMDLRVNDGRLTLPSGMRYRVLVLPDHAVMTVSALEKVKELVQAGAEVIGPKTLKTVSLVGYPASEDTITRLADALWGDAKAVKGIRRVGNGRIAWGYTAKDWLLKQGVPADCRFELASDSLHFDDIHLQRGGADYYFISSQNMLACQAEVSFRVAGKLPEFWDPVTGRTFPAPSFSQQGGVTTVPIKFAPMGSWFVVFRKAISTSQQGNATSNFPEFKPADTLDGNWTVSFDRAWGGPGSVSFTALTSWPERAEVGIKHYSGKATYRKRVNWNRADTANVWIDLGRVEDVGIARVRWNGKDLGVLWCPPYRVRLPAIKPKDNLLEVEVTNSWRNRLVGDRDMPAKDRFTKTNIAIGNDWQLLPAGLLGPVVLSTGQVGK